MRILNPPIVKPKGFCPNPIASYGIPDYANSSYEGGDPNVAGTTAWREFWEEQFYYCMFGYNTSGVFIPGRMYYYLNFYPIVSAGRGTHFPDYVDTDLQFFEKVRAIKEDPQKKGIIIPKARRKGLSYKASAILNHGFHFIEKYQAGIAAGLEEYTEDILNKFEEGLYAHPPEMQMHIRKAKDPIEAGWWEKSHTGVKQKGGIGNKIFHVTMFKDPDQFKGKYLHDVVMEESGEFPLIKRAVNSTEDCLRLGDQIVGTFYIYGTGGRDSEGFHYFINNAEAFGLDLFFVDGRRIYAPYYVGFKDFHGNEASKTPNIDKKYGDLEPEQRLGMEDWVIAEEKIRARRKKLSELDDKTDYYDLLQNMPLDLKEALLDFSENDFDIQKLSEQMTTIQKEVKSYSRYKLEWVRNQDGVPVQPLKVRAIPKKNDEPDCDDTIYIREMPKPMFANLDVIGIDSYNMDKSSTTKSLGAICVLRRKVENGPEKEKPRRPIALYNRRPKTKEKFFEMSAKVCVFYNTINNALIDAGSDLIIKWFEERGLLKYMAKRPRSFESPNSEQLHKYGMKFTGYSKPLQIALLQSEIANNIESNHFEDIIRDCINYDTTSVESDWDAADAWSLALIRDIDMRARPVDQNDPTYKDPFDLPVYEEGPGGSIVNTTEARKLKEEYEDPFMAIVRLKEAEYKDEQQKNSGLDTF